MHSKGPMHSINNVDEGMTHTRPLIPDVPFHPGPTYRPLPNLLDQMFQEVRKVHKVHVVKINISSDINLDFVENSPFQEGIISEAYQRLDKSFFQEP